MVDEFITQATVDYMLKGNDHEDGIGWHVFRMFLPLKLDADERFRALIEPKFQESLDTQRGDVLKGDSSQTADSVVALRAQNELAVQGNAWLRLGWMVSDELASWKRTKGQTGSIKVLGKTYTWRECYLKGLALNPRNVVGWNHISGRDFDTCRTINGKSYTSIECQLKCVELAPDDSFYWYVLLFTGNQQLMQHRRFDDPKHPFTTFYCLERALNCPKIDPQTWIKAAHVLSDHPTSTLRVGTKALDFKAVAEKAMEVNPKSPDALLLLLTTMINTAPPGSPMTMETEVEVSGKTRTVRQLLDLAEGMESCDAGHQGWSRSLRNYLS